MMTCHLWVTSLLLASTALAATERDIADSIRQLGAPDFKTREAATQQLWAAGKDAEAVLELASRSADPEVAQRARRVLADVRSGIGPDTPPAMRDLIRRYRAGDLKEKQAIAAELVAATEPDYKLLSQLAAAEPDHAQRLQVFSPAFEPAFMKFYEVIQLDEVNDVAFGGLMKSVRLWEAVIPEDLAVPLFLLPRLEKWGKKEQAEAVFARALAAQQQVCGRAPQNAEAHNNLAWLCAIGRRQLATGLEHAQQAVVLAPKSAAYIDTLAELEFQMGRTERALELIKQAVELDPDFKYFQQQQKRMEQGDRAAYPPDPEMETGRGFGEVEPEQ